MKLWDFVGILMWIVCVFIVRILVSILLWSLLSGNFLVKSVCLNFFKVKVFVYFWMSMCWIWFLLVICLLGIYF